MSGRGGIDRGQADSVWDPYKVWTDFSTLGSSPNEQWSKLQALYQKIKNGEPLNRNEQWFMDQPEEARKEIVDKISKNMEYTGGADWSEVGPDALRILIGGAAGGIAGAGMAATYSAGKEWQKDKTPTTLDPNAATADDIVKTNASTGGGKVNPVDTSAIRKHAAGIDNYSQYLLTSPKQGGANLVFHDGVGPKRIIGYDAIGNALYADGTTGNQGAPPARPGVPNQGKGNGQTTVNQPAVDPSMLPAKPQEPQYYVIPPNADPRQANLITEKNDALRQQYEKSMAEYNQKVQAITKNVQQTGNSGGYQRFDPTINAEQFYDANSGEFDEAANNYRDVIAGKKSYAMEALKAGMATSRKNMASTMASTVGMNPALKAKSFLGAQRSMEGDVTTQAGVLRAKEANDAMSGLGKVINDKTTQGLGFQREYNNLAIKGAEFGLENQKSIDQMYPKLAGISGEDLSNIVQSEHQTNRENIDATRTENEFTLGKEMNDQKWKTMSNDEKWRWISGLAKLGEASIPIIRKYLPEFTAGKSDSELQQLLDSPEGQNYDPFASSGGGVSSYPDTSNTVNSGNVELLDED